MKQDIIRYFGGGIGKALSLCKEQNVYEIRLRTNAPLSLTLPHSTVFLNPDGQFTDTPDKAVKVTTEDMRRSFEAICRYSVYSCQNQINSGFVTVHGGHRAGICGSAVYSSSGRIENVKNISGINFRVAHEVKGASDEIFPLIMSGSSVLGILICGAPCSGKTTILRDLCRKTGNIIPVSLIDERGELAAVCSGAPCLDVGANTDVFSGYSKHDGINTAVRVMSPMAVFCDEIGSDDDISAIHSASLSGVKTIASIHCRTEKELLSKQKLIPLFRDGVFEKAFFVSSGKLMSVTDIREKVRML